MDEDEDEAAIDRMLRALGLDLPDVETDRDDDTLPPRSDDDWDR